jgi:N-acetyl-anhydromuramyl-L-alanine amidase AmpD
LSSSRHFERTTLVTLSRHWLLSARPASCRRPSPETELSAHYIVLEDGRIVQCVPEANRAWHAGVSSWAGEEDINSCSIGIEIVNRGHDWGYPDFPLRQASR